MRVFLCAGLGAVCAVASASAVPAIGASSVGHARVPARTAATAAATNVTWAASASDGAAAVSDYPQPNINCDLLIVGGGVSGAFAAARYRQYNPDASICVVERGVQVGGRLQSLELSLSPENTIKAELGGMRCVRATWSALVVR